MSQKFGLSKKLKHETKTRVRWCRDRVTGLHFRFPFSQQNCWAIDYWDLMFQNTPCPFISVITSIFHFSFYFVSLLSLHHAPVACLIKTEKQCHRALFPFCWFCKSSLAGLTKLLSLVLLTGRPKPSFLTWAQDYGRNKTRRTRRPRLS